MECLIGLVGVIAASIVQAMVAAGFAGALIPIGLTRMGQDPATSSSILLTTVTDVAGFFDPGHRVGIRAEYLVTFSDQSSLGWRASWLER